MRTTAIPAADVRDIPQRSQSRLDLLGRIDVRVLDRDGQFVREDVVFVGTTGTTRPRRAILVRRMTFRWTSRGRRSRRSRRRPSRHLPSPTITTPLLLPFRPRIAKQPSVLLPEFMMLEFRILRADGGRYAQIASEWEGGGGAMAIPILARRRTRRPRRRAYRDDDALVVVVVVV